jgi:pimeloyl-ACP methyl ester carboxylesterase
MFVHEWRGGVVVDNSTKALRLIELAAIITIFTTFGCATPRGNMKRHSRNLCVLFVAMATWVSVSAHAARTADISRTLGHDVVMADEHPLAVWSRVPDKPKYVILLVHGRTWSALPDFDLQVPQFERSVMQAFAQRQMAVYAVDLRGYGKTPRDASGWNTPNRAAADIAIVLEWVSKRHPQLNKPVLLGWSMGSLLSQLTAQQHPELLSDLILYGYPRDPAAPPAIKPDPEFPPREANTAENAASDFISPQVTPRAIVDAYVSAALKADHTRADWRGQEEYLALDGAKVKNPTLIIHGERDPYAPAAAQSHLFVSLGNSDKQWVVLASGDHAAMLENTHEMFIASITAFITRPTLHVGCDCKKEESR